MALPINPSMMIGGGESPDGATTTYHVPLTYREHADPSLEHAEIEL